MRPGRSLAVYTVSGLISAPTGAGGTWGRPRPGCPSGVGRLPPHLFSPLEPVHPALGAGPEAFRLDSRAHVWMPEPLPGQAPWCRSEIPFPFGKLFSFQPKQLPLCQSGLEVNYVQLCFKIPLPINSCQPLSVWCKAGGTKNGHSRRPKWPGTATFLPDR